MAKVLNDPVFGDLKPGFFWTTRLATSAFGRDTEVWVLPELDSRGRRGEAGEPTEQQREAFVRFIAEQSEMYRRAEKALYEYYRSPQIQEMLADPYRDSETEDPPPTLNEPSDVWGMVAGEACIFIPRQPKDVHRVLTQWDSPFHPDGVQVAFENNQVESVGPVKIA